MKKTEIDKIDEALRLLWLDAGQQANTEATGQELAFILSTPVMKEMPAQKKERLLSELFEAVNTVSLGELLVNKIQTEGITEGALATEARLTPERIEELKTDAVYPNSVPVLLLTTMLKKLSVSFDLAERAIMKTFDIVHKRTLMSPYLSTSGAVYRRARIHDVDDVKGVLRKTSRNELYENKEALFKYLNKLEELMKEQ